MPSALEGELVDVGELLDADKPAGLDELAESRMALQEIRDKVTEPCLARIHYWHEDYVNQALRQPQSETIVKTAAAKVVLFPGGIPALPGNLAIDALDYSVARGRRIEASDDEGIPIEDLMPEPEPVDPLIARIAAKINRFRPKSAAPEDDKDDPERWLKLGQEI